MATKIIDLDALAGDDKIVKLGGKTYRLPADLPVELWLRLQRQAQEGDTSNEDAVEMLYEQLLELFRHRQPDLQELPIGMGQLIIAIGVIYGGAEDEPERPTRRTGSRAGTSNTSSKRRQTKRRS